MKNKKFVQGKVFYFTSFEPIDLELISKSEDFKYLVISKEVAPTTGTIHYHGCGKLFKSYKLKRLQKILVTTKEKSNELHIEKVISFQDCINYCKKDGEIVFEKGTYDVNKKGKAVTQGKRSDLEKVVKILRNDGCLDDVIDLCPTEFIKYPNGITKFDYFLKKGISKTWRDIECFVYYGETGAGKTKKAVEDADGDYYILNTPGSNGMIWFDGYTGEKTLIIDDFYGWIKQHELLRIMDGYPYHCQIKGSFTWAQWTKVVFTSNKHPDEWFQYGLQEAFLRRCPRENFKEFVIKKKEDDLKIFKRKRKNSPIFIE